MQQNLIMPGILNGGVQVADRNGFQQTLFHHHRERGYAAFRYYCTAVAGAGCLDHSRHAFLADSIAPMTTLLLQGGILACPLAKLYSATHAATITPVATGALYGIDPVLFAQSNLALAGLVASQVQVKSSDAQDTITAMDNLVRNDTLNTVLARFADKGVQVGLSDMIKANSATALFITGASALLPALPTSLSVSLGASLPAFAEPVFALEVSLQITRLDTLVNQQFQTASKEGPVEQVISVVPAPVQPTDASTQGSVNTETLTEFSLNFMSVFADLRLASGRTAVSDSELWIVDFSSQGIASVTVAQGVTLSLTQTAPRSFAIRPLYQSLISRPGLKLQTLDVNGNLQPNNGATTDFQGIDVEIWANQFLGDVDLFLSPPYLSGIYADATARSAIQSVMASKALLVSGIAGGLAPVLNVTAGTPQAAWESAAQSLENELGLSLLNGYQTSAVVQYDASVTSAWVGYTTLKPAKLYGDPSLINGSLSLGKTLSVTNAKTALNLSSSYVNTLLTVQNTEYHSTVPLELDYTITHLEYDIHPVTVQGTDTYDASNWLTFVPALKGSALPASLHMNLGSADIPLPLRSYPALPKVVGQTATEGWGDAKPTLQTAGTWDYTLSYAHTHAAQDTLWIETKYNIPQQLSTARLTATVDMAALLAQYIMLRQQLWAFLSYYAVAGSPVNPESAANAAQSFAALVVAVAGGWANYWSPPVNSSQRFLSMPQTQTYQFNGRIIFDEMTGELTAYELTSLQDQPGPLPDEYLAAGQLCGAGRKCNPAGCARRHRQYAQLCIPAASGRKRDAYAANLDRHYAYLERVECGVGAKWPVSAFW